jgi:hypothetical protein
MNCPPSFSAMAPRLIKVTLETFVPVPGISTATLNITDNSVYVHIHQIFKEKINLEHKQKNLSL